MYIYMDKLFFHKTSKENMIVFMLEEILELYLHVKNDCQKKDNKERFLK